MYTREMLEEKTVVELREIARLRGITGVSKKRKDVIIDRILNDQFEDVESDPIHEQQNRSPMTGIDFNAVSKVTNPGGGRGSRLTTMCQISSGAASQQFDVAGHNIAEVTDFMSEVLNIEPTSDAIVNGSNVNSDYIIQPGDKIEFVKAAGRKG